MARRHANKDEVLRLMRDGARLYSYMGSWWVEKEGSWNCRVLGQTVRALIPLTRSSRRSRIGVQEWVVAEAEDRIS